MLEFLSNLDTQLLLFLNGLHSEFWDAVMVFASGKLTWLPLYLLLIYLLYRKYRWDVLWWLVAIALVVLVVDQVSSSLIKPLAARLRPTHDPALENLVHIVNGYRGGLYGFVSSHAANTFGVATLLSFLYRNRWATVGLMVWAAFVSYSRIYLGVHYPGDVLCGALLGVGVGIGIFYAARWAIDRYLKNVLPSTMKF